MKRFWRRFLVLLHIRKSGYDLIVKMFNPLNQTGKLGWLKPDPPIKPLNSKWSIKLEELNYEDCVDCVDCVGNEKNRLT
jgi:hypothetical protein